MPSADPRVALPTTGRHARSRVRTIVIDTLRRIPGHAGSARGRVVSTDEAPAPDAPATGSAE